MIKNKGEIITFYSYKGGVGRTMALANIATLLAKWNYRVLIIDWDLEAPGLEFFFKEYLDIHIVSQQEGVIDILYSAFDDNHSSQDALKWQDFVLPITLPDFPQPINFLTAGKKDDTYFSKVRNLDLQEFYTERNGGLLIESLRKEWEEAYDYILIDSRTGITDIGGICTIQLPDILALFFTATEQSLEGIIDVAQKANQARQKLPLDRFNLLCVPIPSRFDSQPEFKISQEWLDRFAKELSGIYANWLPESANKRDFLEKTKIPYSPYFSFGEKLPVIEHGTTDPTGLGYAYETVAALFAHKLDSAVQIIDNRDQYVSATLNLREKINEQDLQKSSITSNEIVSMDFINRCNEFQYIVNSYCPAFLSINAPRGYGKTRLLREIINYFLNQNWLCIYIPFSIEKTYQTIQGIIRNILQQFDIPCPPNFDQTTLEELRKCIGSEILKASKNIIFIIDNIESLPVEVTVDCFNFLLSLMDIINIYQTDENIRLRMITAGWAIKKWEDISAHLPVSFSILRLTLFDFSVVFEIVKNFAFKNKKIMDIQYNINFAACLMNITGGHPATILRILYQDFSAPIKILLKKDNEYYSDFLTTILEDIQIYLPNEFIKIFKKLSIFRIYNHRLLQKIIDEKLIPYSGNTLILERQLMSTYLIRQKQGFIQDDIVRRLFAIQLRKELGDKEFARCCLAAKEIYQYYLQETNAQPHSIAIEMLYQDLQYMYYMKEEHMNLSTSFFGENGILETCLKLLSQKDEATYILQGFEHVLQETQDWEFRFTLNFFLRDEHYTDEPYQRLLYEVNKYISTTL